MGVIGNLLNRKRERARREQEVADEDRIHANIGRKKLSHNEREVIAILNKEREKNLKEFLQWEEKRRRADELFHERNMWRGGINLLE